MDPTLPNLERHCIFHHDENKFTSRLEINRLLNHLILPLKQDNKAIHKPLRDPHSQEKQMKTKPLVPRDRSVVHDQRQQHQMAHAPNMRTLSDTECDAL